jgi:hypothetical protein
MSFAGEPYDGTAGDLLETKAVKVVHKAATSNQIVVFGHPALGHRHEDKGVRRYKFKLPDHVPRRKDGIRRKP